MVSPWPIVKDDQPTGRVRQVKCYPPFSGALVKSINIVKMLGTTSEDELLRDGYRCTSNYISHHPLLLSLIFCIIGVPVMQPD